MCETKSVVLPRFLHNFQPIISESLQRLETNPQKLVNGKGDAFSPFCRSFFARETRPAWYMHLRSTPLSPFPSPNIYFSTEMVLFIIETQCLHLIRFHSDHLLQSKILLRSIFKLVQATNISCSVHSSFPKHGAVWFSSHDYATLRKVRLAFLTEFTMTELWRRSWRLTLVDWLMMPLLRQTSHHCVKGCCF